MEGHGRLPVCLLPPGHGREWKDAQVVMAAGAFVSPPHHGRGWKGAQVVMAAGAFVSPPRHGRGWKGAGDFRRGRGRDAANASILNYLQSAVQ